MDMMFSPHENQFRAEVRAFLSQNLPEALAARTLRGYRPLSADVRQWTAILHRRGWSVPSWPVEQGGPGWSPQLRHIFEEECYLAGAPQLWTQGVSLVGPCIILFGSEEQKARYLPGIRSGEDLWAQGFSEPDAGSDLASLKTRATRDGNRYVINGQKIWTSDAHEADYLFLLARTSSESRPQRGISFFLVPTDAPGLSFRPIRSIDESHSLNQTFLDNVVVPAKSLVGIEGLGWTYAKALLSEERAFHAEIPRNKYYLRRLKSLARSEPDGARSALCNAHVRTQIAALEIELQALEFLTLATLHQPERSEARSRSSVLKIRGSAISQRLTALMVQILGDNAARVIPNPALAGVESDAQHGAGVIASFMIRRAASIAGGSNEIQRNIIAKHALGL